MGASTSSYSGKGSTSGSRSSTRRSTNSPMIEMLRLLEEVESCREEVASREADWNSAKKKLEQAEKKAIAQINKLDPKTKARFRAMLGESEREQDGR